MPYFGDSPALPLPLQPTDRLFVERAGVGPMEVPVSALLDMIPTPSPEDIGAAPAMGIQKGALDLGVQASLDAAEEALQPGALPAGTTLEAAQISDAGAAGRELLRKETLPEIQALVSGGAAAAVSAPKTLAAADRGRLQQTITTQAFTVTSSTLLAGWHAPIDGPCTFVSGTGSPTITDRRESGATYPFCVISAATSGYLISGSKL